jgi:hypothetical protein
MATITSSSSMSRIDSQKTGRLAVQRSMGRALIAIVVAAAVGGAAVASPAAAKPGTVKVKGTFENQIFSGPKCASPVRLCVKGEFRGSLKGPDEAVAHSMTPTTEPHVVLGDMTLTIHDKRGDLTCHELFLFNTAPSGEGPFSWLCEITSGTRRYAGASGYLQGIGLSAPSSGASIGTYRGVIALQ